MRLFLVLLFVVLSHAAVPAFTCMDENGKPVAWWSALKFPSGTSYQYADVHNPSYVMSKNLMADPNNGCLARTMQQLYKANATYSAADYAFVYYNDGKPAGSDSSSRGHTKGVVGLTQAGGFYLVHSVPKFPNFMNQGYNGYAAPSSDIYGQSFLCISASMNEFHHVGSVFYYSFPQYYDWNMPSWVPSELYSAVTASNHTTQAVAGVIGITATDGTKFTAFSKTTNWNNYLYENLIASYWKSDLYVETWMNGANPVPSFCKNATVAYDVMNVRALSAFGINYLETQDHSKWCISTHNSMNLVCIGDINMQQSQNNRAGGSTCFINKSTWTSIKNMITQADSCPALWSEQTITATE